MIRARSARGDGCSGETPCSMWTCSPAMNRAAWRGVPASAGSERRCGPTARPKAVGLVGDEETRLPVLRQIHASSRRQARACSRRRQTHASSRRRQTHASSRRRQTHASSRRRLQGPSVCRRLQGRRCGPTARPKTVGVVGHEVTRLPVLRQICASSRRQTHASSRPQTRASSRRRLQGPSVCWRLQGRGCWHGRVKAGPRTTIGSSKDTHTLIPVCTTAPPSEV
jgi:hypothetical protein